ncbi:MAG TPA: tetratricopeptide repeat protein [Chloroflexota bacterium]|nr:tetratricopeptide repeat protein [Chloroflexota bacterium]
MQLFGRRQEKQPQDQDEKLRKQAAEAERSALLFLQGRLYQQAASELRRAVSLNPSSTTGHAYLGMVLQRLGELDDAASELLLAVTLAPADDGLRRTYGAVLETLDKLDAARDQYQVAVQLQPSDALGLGALGSLLLRLGERQAGEQLLRQAIAADPRDPVTLADLASIEHKAGNLQGAIDLLKRGLDLLADESQPPVVRLGAMPAPPDSVATIQGGFQHTLGLYFEEAGNLKGSEQLLRLALTALPANPSLLADLARVLVRQARLSDALALYGKAERDFPEQRLRYQQDLSSLVAEHGMAGRSAPPTETVSRAPEATILSPAQPSAAAPPDTTDPIVLLQRQLREDPENRSLRRDLSVALLRAGRVAEALEEARVVEQMLSQRHGSERAAG